MSIYRTITDDSLSIVIWNITESTETLIEISGCSLPDKFTNQTRVKEYLAVRCCAKHIGINPSTIDYLPSGKPYLNNCDKAISISHTKNYAAVITGKNNMPAIDIETRSERILKIRRKFMSDQEETALKSSGFDEVTGLLIHWCAKESLFKAIHDENVDFAKELIVNNLINTGNKGRFNAFFTRDETSFVVNYLLEEDFVLTWCHI